MPAFSRFVLTLVAVIGFAAHAAAQARVEGTVKGIDGKPVAGVMVRVEGSDLPKPRTTTTGADGTYVVADLKLGQWVQVVAYQDGRKLAIESTLVTRAVEKVDDVGQDREQLVPPLALAACLLDQSSRLAFLGQQAEEMDEEEAVLAMEVAHLVPDLKQRRGGAKDRLAARASLRSFVEEGDLARPDHQLESAKIAEKGAHGLLVLE